MISEACCVDMEDAQRPGFDCTPHVVASTEGLYIRACHDDLERLPFRYCPWCGEQLVAEEDVDG